MARYFVGYEYATAGAAREAFKEGRPLTGPLRILRLREAAGPSTAERLAKLEEHARLAAVQDAIARLEADALDMRTRIGDLERLPVASEAESEPVRPEQGGEASFDPIARRAAVDTLCRGLAALDAGEPDPDRLAKVAHRAEIDKHLARPYTDAEFNALLPQGRDRLRRIAANVSAAVAADRDALLARAEKANREFVQWVDEACDVAKALAPYREETSAAFVSRAPDIRALVADWQKRGEELSAIASRAGKAEREVQRLNFEVAILRGGIAEHEKCDERAAARRAEDMRRGFEIAALGARIDDPGLGIRPRIGWYAARAALTAAIQSAADEASEHLDCRAHGCRFAIEKGGMRTNGGCHCAERPLVMASLAKLYKAARGVGR